MPKLAAVTEDHSVRLVARPISAPAQLVWRVSTFGRVTLDRLAVNNRRFPRLVRRLPVPAIEYVETVPGNPELRAIMSRYRECTVPGRVTFLPYGEAAFSRIEDSIGAAQTRIDIQTYIFDNDAYAMEIADLLRERDAAGVDVRIRMDAIGSRRAWTVHAAGAPSPPEGGRLNMIRYLKRRSGILVRREPNVWLSSDHVKFITVDSHTVYFGGMNIGWEYRYQWRDMMSELTGPVVTAFERYFDSAWRRSGWLGEFELLRRLFDEQPAYETRDGDAELYVLVTTPWRHRYFKAVLAAIDAAQHRIYVETPYLWNKKVLYALCRARHRGVDVRALIPMASNVKFARGADRIAANTLLQHKVRVFLYPRMTHNKAMLIDNWAVWGTANKDDFSLHKNIELNLATDHPPVAEALRAIMLDGQDTATELLDPVPVGVWDRLSSKLTDLL